MFYHLVAIILYQCLYHRYFKPLPMSKKIVFTLFFIYMYMVLQVTILPIPFRFQIVGNIHFNMTPFVDVLANRGDAMRQVYLNVFMFMPFGFLYPMLTKQSIYTTLFWTMLFSASIEGIQFLYSYLWNSIRICDITDLITNTMGGVIGYLLYTIYQTIHMGMVSNQLQSYDEYL